MQGVPARWWITITGKACRIMKALYFGLLKVVLCMIRRNTCMDNVRVYLAGPYSVGNKEANVVTALIYAETLIKKGFCPYIPHLSHYWDLEYPHDYKFWLEYDEHWLAVCDCVLRIPGESVGADREMKFAINRGIPVCLDIESLERWRKETKGAPAPADGK